MPPTTQVNHQTNAEEAIRQFEIQAINFGYIAIKESRVRQSYMQKTHDYAQSLRQALKTGEISSKEAAQMAQEMRNEIMNWSRAQSTELGRAMAIKMKKVGLDMDTLLDKYAVKAFGKKFSELSLADRDTVYLAIVDSSGRPQAKVSSNVAKLSKAGRGLWLLSLGIAAYNIASAEDKTRATGREVANAGGGFAGGAAGGAVAGIWAGPLGVAAGVAIGGLIGAIIADQVYIEATPSNTAFVQALIDKHTTVVSTNEEAIATALIKECSYQMDKVLAVFKELD